MSSSGFQFLVSRKDTGKYVYQRDLNPRLAAHVSGVVTLDWRARTVELQPGRSVIKVSLSTGDEQTARLRWLHVHGQVEALVRMAQVTLNIEATRPRAIEPVKRLKPDVIATLAGQMKHDRLAAHDQGWIDPTFTSPLASVVLKVLRQSTIKAADRDLVEYAQRRGEDMLDEQARAALQSRDTGWPDRSIRVSELDPGLFDIDGLRSGRIRQLTPA